MTTLNQFFIDETPDKLEERFDKAINNPDNTGRADTYDKVPQPKTVTYTDYENPFSLVDQSSGAPHISKLSSNAWVGCGDDIYVLDCLGKGHIRIEPVNANKGELLIKLPLA